MPNENKCCPDKGKPPKRKIRTCACPCHKENYERISHSHCWNQDGKPACGIPLEKHTQCCLCDLPTPTKTSWEKEFDNKFPTLGKMIVDVGGDTDEVDMKGEIKIFIGELLSSHIPKIDLAELIGEHRKEAYQEGYEIGKLDASKEMIPLEEVVGMIDEIMFEDPRVEGHAPHPAKDWANCEACMENYNWNSALSSLKQKLEERRTNQK